MATLTDAPVRVRDLPSDPPYNVALRCDRCAESFSATKGDYFMAPPDQIMRCACGRNLRLARKLTRYDDWNGKP